MSCTDVNFIVLACSYVAPPGWAQLDSPDSNKVPPRLFLFAASNIVVLIMWARLAWCCKYEFECRQFSCNGSEDLMARVEPFPEKEDEKLWPLPR